MSTEPNLSRLIEMAKAVRMSDDQNRQQRNSFVYGNTRTENPKITWDLVERKGAELDDEQRASAEKQR